MGKNDGKARKAMIWCPECGTPMENGFSACPNCKLKVMIAGKTGKEQNEKKASSPEKREKTEPEKTSEEDREKPAEANPLNESGHPRYWNF